MPNLKRLLISSDCWSQATVENGGETRISLRSAIPHAGPMATPVITTVTAEEHCGLRMPLLQFIIRHGLRKEVVSTKTHVVLDAGFKERLISSQFVNLGGSAFLFHRAWCELCHDAFAHLDSYRDAQALIERTSTLIAQLTSSQICTTLRPAFHCIVLFSNIRPHIVKSGYYAAKSVD